MLIDNRFPLINASLRSSLSSPERDSRFISKLARKREKKEEKTEDEGASN